MKTLDKEVQIAIINEAGSTYRNYILAALKDGYPQDTASTSAITVSQSFIDMCTKNLGESMKIGSLSAISATYGGSKSMVVTLYKWALTQPKVPEFCVIHWESGDIMKGSKLSGWSSSKLLNPGNAGETLFELKLGVSAPDNELYTAVDLKDCKIQSIAYNGKQGI